MKRLYTLFASLLLASAAIAQCQAGFTFTGANNTFTFTDTSTTASGSIVAWGWDFGDFSGSTQQNPVHTYDVCGYYVVTLTIGTSTFCTSSFSDTVLVNSGFSGSYTFTVDTTDGTTQFQAQPVSGALNYTWDFGDSSTGTGPAPSHQYATSGTYNVCVVIADTANICSDTICDTVNVYIAPPTCNATFTTNAITQGNYGFTAAPFNQDWDYAWDFGDASTGAGFFVTHQYTAAGTYTVCLSITDSTTGCTSQFCDTLTVPPFVCNATWTNTSLAAGQQTFTASPFDVNWTYDWDFGDATTGNGFIVNHTYAASGTYTVCLTINDAATGCTSQFCDTVIINFPVACPPSFTATGLNGIYVFTASPFSISNTYTWDYGDGSPNGTGFVSNHTYTVSGTYTVCLTMTTPQGCTGTFCDTLNVIISSIEEQNSTLPVQLFPSPATDRLTVTYTLSSATNVTLEVCDLAGRVLLTNALSRRQPGMQREEISLDALAPGVYLLRVTTENNAGNLVFVKAE